jgi:hypothetical protein
VPSAIFCFAIDFDKGKPIIETLANMWYYELIRLCGKKYFNAHKMF